MLHGILKIQVNNLLLFFLTITPTTSILVGNSKTMSIYQSNKYQMLIIMIRPKPRTGELRLNASGHIKRCDVKT